MLTSPVWRLSCAVQPRLCVRYLLRVLSSSTHNAGDRPQMHHLEHVQKRLEYTVPLMFRERLDYTFYTPDVVCEDHILSVRRVGLDRLMSHLGYYSVAGQILFPHIEMEALNIVPMLDDGTVRVRWRVKHVSILRALLNPRYFSSEYRLKRLHWYDGYSIFFVDGNGFVNRFTIQKTMPDDERNYNKKTATQRIAEKIGVLPKQAATNFIRVQDERKKS